MYEWNCEILIFTGRVNPDKDSAEIGSILAWVNDLPIDHGSGSGLVLNLPTKRIPFHGRIPSRLSGGMPSVRLLSLSAQLIRIVARLGWRDSANDPLP
jgi:hypothetical protein